MPAWQFFLLVQSSSDIFSKLPRFEQGGGIRGVTCCTPFLRVQLKIYTETFSLTSVLKQLSFFFFLVVLCVINVYKFFTLQKLLLVYKYFCNCEKLSQNSLILLLRRYSEIFFFLANTHIQKANKSLSFLCPHFSVKSWDSLGLSRAEYGPHFGDMV